MANSTAALPACPRCKRTSDITPLVREGDRQRFNCGACSENFWDLPVPGVPDPAVQTAPRGSAFSPIAILERTATEAAEPKRMCLKCGKPYFNLGQRFEAHVASCDGKKRYVAPGSRRRRAARVDPAPPSPEQIYGASLAALRARRAALEAEIAGLDVAIAGIEKLKGAGGAAPAPFPSGGPPTP